MYSKKIEMGVSKYSVFISLIVMFLESSIQLAKEKIGVASNISRCFVFFRYGDYFFSRFAIYKGGKYVFHVYFFSYCS